MHYRDLHQIGQMNIHKCGGLPANHRNFLQNANFVSYGGLKWSTALDELNGVFTNYDKWKKYGHQWAKFNAKNIKSEYYVVILGSNDADDFFSRTLTH